MAMQSNCCDRIVDCSVVPIAESDDLAVEVVGPTTEAATRATFTCREHRAVLLDRHLPNEQTDLSNRKLFGR